MFRQTAPYRRIYVKSLTVKELMVPLSEYATVPVGSTLFDAIQALEKAQEEFDHTKYRHRAVLILDKNKRVIGKLTQMDVLWALEPKSKDLSDIDELSRFGFTHQFVRVLKKERRLHGEPLKALCTKAAKLRVEDFMQAPTEAEYVDEGTVLDMAIHQLVLGNHLSLLVTRGKDIVGLLRLTDVFAAVFHTMKECEINP